MDAPELVYKTLGQGSSFSGGPPTGLDLELHRSGVEGPLRRLRRLQRPGLVDEPHVGQGVVDLHGADPTRGADYAGRGEEQVPEVAPYVPLNCGGRPSKKAATPSFWSPDSEATYAA